MRQPPVSQRERRSFCRVAYHSESGQPRTGRAARWPRLVVEFRPRMPVSRRVPRIYLALFGQVWNGGSRFAFAYGTEGPSLALRMYSNFWSADLSAVESGRMLANKHQLRGVK